MKKNAPDYYQNKTADVIFHGQGSPVPSHHWELNTSFQDPFDPWGPISGKNRPQPHVKLNECDH